MNTSEKIDFLLEYLGVTAKEFAANVGMPMNGVTEIRAGRTKGIAESVKIAAEYVYNIDRHWWADDSGAARFLITGAGQPALQVPANPLAELDKESRKLVEGLVHVLVQRKVSIAPKVSSSFTSRPATKSQEYPHDKLREIPKLGRIAAGPLTEIGSYRGESLLFPREIIPDPGPLYALRVYGESMRDAGIHDGDYAILNSVPDPRDLVSGAVVAAMVDGENTLKRLYLRDGGAVLRAANPEFRDIEVRNHQELVIQGQLKYLIKNWQE